MSKIIAFAGKGGVGKTTVAALVIRNLARNGKAPVL
ncbi:MAG: protein AcsF, partial [Desulfobulbaceae bacterium]